MNRRKATLILTVAITLLISAIYIAGVILSDDATFDTNLAQKALPPSAGHPFGTDFLGRDMLTRTIRGMSLSLFVGLAASGVSALIALIVGVCAAFGRGIIDHIINWIIDLTMGIPHILLVILISIAAGRGWTGLMVGIILTHWTGLARIIRGEVLQIRSNHYIETSRKLGHSGMWIMTRHIMPHMIPQFFIGLILMFPHAIMHESGLTFLGFGMPPEQPAIGIILSESMRYLSAGMWWVAVFPGLALAAMVVLIDRLGECVKLLLDPFSAQE